MPTRKTDAKQVSPSRPGHDEVDDYLRKLDHPLKPEIEALRSIILGASPAIGEGVKWNSPSFRTTEYFATINIGKDLLRLIFHFGAKVKGNRSADPDIRDPAGLLEWPSKDRGVAKFRDLKGINANRAALKDIVQQWIAHRIGEI